MRNNRLTKLEERAVLKTIFVAIAVIIILTVAPVKCSAAEQHTIAVYGKASSKVCEARLKLAPTKKPMVFYATFSVMVPACPRPTWITTCYFREPQSTLH
jgi:hypothetical protein